MRSGSTGVRIAIAALVVALIALSAVTYSGYRRNQDLERSLAEQRRDPGGPDEDSGPGEGAGEPDPADAFEDLAKDLQELIGGEGLGDSSDLFGSGATDVLKCLEADPSGGDPDGGLGDLFGGGDEKDAELPPQKLVGQIARQVSKLRALRYEHDVPARFLSDSRLESRIAELFLEDYSRADANREGRILSALGAVPDGSDLMNLRKSALEGQIAGFYVPETNELVVRTSSSGIGALEKTTLAHELQHALADQNFELPSSVGRDPARADAELATLALIEGDATLTMQRFTLSFLSLDDQLSMLSGSADLLAAQRQLETMPHYLRQELTFPYLDGMSFVCDLYAQGGWAAVDRVYSHHPASTAQILWPERYVEGDEPAPVRAPGDPGGDWKESVRSSFGAAELKWLFEAPGDDLEAALDDPVEAAAAWGGGELRLFTDGDASAVGIALVQHAGRQGLCESVSAWYEAAFEDDGEVPANGDEALVRDGANRDAVVSCTNDEVRVGIAPDLDTARALVD